MFVYPYMAENGVKMKMKLCNSHGRAHPDFESLENGVDTPSTATLKICFGSIVCHMNLRNISK